MQIIELNRIEAGKEDGPIFINIDYIEAFFASKGKDKTIIHLNGLGTAYSMVSVEVTETPAEIIKKIKALSDAHKIKKLPAPAKRKRTR